MPVQVFPFDADLNIGDSNTKRSILGGKGANLNTMVVDLKMPVPPGFTITTDACFVHDGQDKIDPLLRSRVSKQVSALEDLTGKKFGGAAKMPLLLSVRSGAPVSMPGMMDTLLNLGLNDKSVRALAKRTNERFAYDSYRRFIQMFSTIVFGVESKVFSNIDAAVSEFFMGEDVAERHQMAIERYIAKLDKLGLVVPQDVDEQLDAAILAVFKSWNSDRARSYRNIEGISDDLGTAVNVQSMVFGNLNDNSGTGVAFTRNPNTGANERFGDFLVNAQGEDVVAGLAQTQPLSEMSTRFPEQAEELENIMVRLEEHYLDMCDIEFTIEDGKLYMLQTRTGKRNSKAAVAIAFDFFEEGKIDRPTAIQRIEEANSKGGPAPAQAVEVADTDITLGTATPASPGVVQGRVVFNSPDAVAAKANGEDVILVREETSPDDIDGMHAAIGILTKVGGLVSHAAVVARAWEKPCVVGFADMRLNEVGEDVVSITVGEHTLDNTNTIRIDGATGIVTLIS